MADPLTILALGQAGAGLLGGLFGSRRSGAERRLDSFASRLAERLGLLEGRADQLRGEAAEAFRRFDPNEFLSADALQALFDQAGVGFRGDLAALQARNARRGIRGPLSGALEGDLFSAFHRNLMSTAANFAGQRANLALSRAQGLAGIAGMETALLGDIQAQLLEMMTGQAERAAQRRRLAGTGLGAGLGLAAGLTLGRRGTTTNQPTATIADGVLG